ncbi:MAG: hypothetical protein ACLRZ9_11540 [Eubacterium sp.]
MRVYSEENLKESTEERVEKKLEEIYCNNCGRKIKVQNGIVREGVLSIDYKWDYFSEKDGMKHSFDICEECYDKIIKNFVYPVSEMEYTELL